MQKINIFVTILTALLLNGCLFEPYIIEIGDKKNTTPIVGFRDMLWGDGIEKLGNYTVIYNNEASKLTIAAKKDDKLYIGEAELGSIKYSFFDNMFFEVTIKYSYSDNNDLIIETLKNKYGLIWIKNSKTASYTDGYKMIDDKIVENKVYYSYKLKTPSSYGVERDNARIWGEYKGIKGEMNIKSFDISKAYNDYTKKIDDEKQRQKEKQKQQKLKEAVKDL
jgi:hypothetical protein